jgi:hypothetical protein
MSKYLIISVAFILVTLLLFTNSGQCSYNTRDIQKETSARYTIQVASYHLSDSVKAKHHFMSLKQKGQLVFLFNTYINGQTWLRVRIGQFSSFSQAKIISKKIKQELETECYIDESEFILLEHKEFKILQAPSGIWLIRDNSYHELFDLSPSLFDDDIFSYYTYPFISSSGKDVLFEYNGNIIEVNLSTFDRKIIHAEGVGNSIPQKSSSGRYIAYIDNNMWESPSNLWILGKNGQRKCLANSKDLKGHAVKFFKWHPSSDVIFFIAGYAYGTQTVGGELYSVDLKGSVQKLISSKSDKRQELVFQFNIAENTLFYKIAQYDESYSSVEYSDHTISINQLLQKMEN